MENSATPNKKRDICLWLVDGSARVRKFRLTYFRLSIFAGFFALLGGLLFLVAGDYSRVQVLRFKNYLLLQKLEYQKDALLDSNRRLENELSDLKSLNDKVLAYEQDVKEKLFEMSKVIEGATSIDILEDDEESELAAPLDAGGVGGAELDCSGSSSRAGCNLSSWSDVGLRGRLDPSLITSPQQIAMLPALNTKQVNHNLPSEGLPEKIERYIKFLRELPLKNPAPGKITSGFGRRLSPFTKHLSIHQGIDISLNHGTAITAAASGVILNVESNPTYGLMVDVQHNPRLVTRYAHLNKVLVKLNQRVKAGDIIALSGSSGRSTGPHLHYEVRIDGEAKNPKNFLNLKEKLKNIF